MASTKYTVLLLAGGDSAERDVSLDSSRGIAGALREAGHRVLVADPARPELTPSENHDEFFRGAGIHATPPELDDDPFSARAEFARVLSGYRAYGVDAVFNGLHGGAGEDGTIPAVLDYLGVPYTGSGAEASALAMDKHRAKLLCAAVGVGVPRGIRVARSGFAAGTLEPQVRESFAPPVIVKPNAQGSSVGLSVVHSFDALDAAAEKAFTVDEVVLVEEFIAGREITQAVLEGVTDIPVLEIRPKSGLYDYYHKYQPGGSEYLVPAPVDDEVAAVVRDYADRVFHALGMADYARIDFRLSEDNAVYMLEANTLPGMTATSLVPKSVAAVGISYTELCDRILHLAVARQRSR